MRLIDADALRERLLDTKATQEKQHNGIGLMATTDALIEVEASPTIDAEPVRHGRWIDEGLYADYYPHHEWQCSECGEQVIEVDTPLYKYCPNCGAKMDGGDHA